MSATLPPAARLGAALALVALLGACASAPIDTELAPEARRADAVATAPGTATGQVLWGGAIVAARNVGTGTELEVLSYPLDRSQRPMTGKASEGRFLIVADGYLETVDYAPGRSVTVLGTLDGVREMPVDEARIPYPVVRSSELHLWRPDDGARVLPRFSIGIGLGL